MEGGAGVTGCMPDDCSVSPIMGCHLLSSIHKSKLCVCVLEKEREMGERDCLLFGVCEEEEDRIGTGMKLGSGRTVKKKN